MSYFYFSLTCRLPTFCLFISTLALMIFLLTVAWAAWPTAVLVMCCCAGTLLTLQYLVFGVRRTASFVVRLLRGCIGWRRRRMSAMQAQISVPPVDLAQETSPPPPYSSMSFPSPQLANTDAVTGAEGFVLHSDVLLPSVSRRDEP